MNDSILNTAVPGEDIPAGHDSKMASQSIGTRLSAQREALGWSVEQVASQLNLAPRQIQALEQDNYAALPGIASVRGFIRAYAKLLKIDSAALIALIPAENIQVMESLHTRPSLETPFSHGASLPSLGSATSTSKFTLLLIAVAALAVAAFQLGWVSLASLPLSMPTLSSGAPKEAQSNAGNNEVAQSLQPASGIEPAAGAAEPAVKTDSDAAAPVDVTPSAPVVPQPADAVAPAQNALVLTMHQDSWIEARRVGKAGESTQQTGGNTLISRLIKSGETTTIDVSEPIVLTVGNASGVEASLRGTALDLTAAAKNNIARINVK
jgi:cytoskeleton protein RodZ